MSTVKSFCRGKGKQTLTELETNSISMLGKPERAWWFNPWCTVSASRETSSCSLSTSRELNNLEYSVLNAFEWIESDCKKQDLGLSRVTISLILRRTQRYCFTAELESPNLTDDCSFQDSLWSNPQCPRLLPVATKDIRSFRDCQGYSWFEWWFKFFLSSIKYSQLMWKRRSTWSTGW
jgi:hypothetical protein